jgi:hypothetical protein
MILRKFFIFFEAARLAFVKCLWPGFANQKNSKIALNYKSLNLSTPVDKKGSSEHKNVNECFRLILKSGRPLPYPDTP